MPNIIPGNNNGNWVNEVTAVALPYAVAGIDRFRRRVHNVISGRRLRSSEPQVNSTAAVGADVLSDRIPTAPGVSGYDRVNFYPQMSVPRDSDGFINYDSLNTMNPMVINAGGLNASSVGATNTVPSSSTGLYESIHNSVDFGMQTDPLVVPSGFPVPESLSEGIINSLDSLNLVDFFGLLNVPANIVVRLLIMKGVQYGVHQALSLPGIVSSLEQRQHILDNATTENLRRFFSGGDGSDGTPGISIEDLVKRYRQTQVLDEKIPALLKFATFVVANGLYIIAALLTILIIVLISVRLYQISCEVKALRSQKKDSKLTVGGREVVIPPGTI